MKNLQRGIVYLFLIVLSCKDPGNVKSLSGNMAALTPDLSQIFNSYLLEVGLDSMPDNTHYFLFVSSKMCALCEDGVLKGFSNFKQNLLLDDITLITDFECGEVQIGNHMESVCFSDASGLFNQYSFPRAYISLYKTVGREVESYVFLSEKEKFSSFLIKEGLLK